MAAAASRTAFDAAKRDLLDLLDDLLKKCERLPELDTQVGDLRRVMADFKRNRDRLRGQLSDRDKRAFQVAAEEVADAADNFVDYVRGRDIPDDAKYVLGRATVGKNLRKAIRECIDHVGGLAWTSPGTTSSYRLITPVVTLAVPHQRDAG